MMTDRTVRHEPSAWRVRQFGRAVNGPPTNANLARAIGAFEQSTVPGGINGHLGRAVVESARIVRQKDGAVMAEYRKDD